MQAKIRTVMMRGGTSRALFFRDEDLPQDEAARTRILLAAFGSPDPYGRQIDGVGGATSSTSKAAIIRTSRKEGVDIEYTFGQVAVDRPLVDFTGSCGNIWSAVGPYALDEGLVPSSEPITSVRILATNTGKLAVAHVPTRQGRFIHEGDYEIPGIPGTGSRIDLEFLDPGGSLTGKLLPTGNPFDLLAIKDVGPIEVSVVDAGHPFVFCRFEDVGLTGSEEPSDIDADRLLLHKLEAIRAAAGHRAGLATTPEDITQLTPSTPRLVLVSKPRSYRMIDGTIAGAKGLDLVVQAISMGRAHRSYPLTGAISTAVAAAVPGTVVNRIIADRPEGVVRVRLGHPSGALEVEANVVADGLGHRAASVRVARTARRLMEGFVLVPDWVSAN